MPAFSLKLSKDLIYLFIFSAIVACKPAFVLQPGAKAINIEINGELTSDSTINDLIAPYKATLDEKMILVIGEAAITLDNKPGSGESLLGNFVADLLLERSQYKYKKPIDMAIINAHGGLRTNINKGEIKVEDLFELMPFENTMLVLELSGELTQKFFDRCAVTKRNNVAGARFTIQDNHASQITINGEVFDSNRSYTLAISDYLAEGGGGFDFLKEARLVQDLGYKARDMIIDYVKLLNKNGQKISAAWDQRIKIIE